MNQFKTLFGTAQALFLLVVVIVLAWNYFLRDLIYPEIVRPEAAISHEVFSACLNADVRWLRIETALANTGSTDITIGRAQHQLARIAPAEDFDRRQAAEAIDWPRIAEHDTGPAEPIAPGERSLQYLDFFVDPLIQVVEITSRFESAQENPAESTVWQTRTIYDTGEASCQ